ncbi:putative mucin TcMUC [Pseudomonas paraeruginosa]|uniref:Mucin TcMUC n=1 Tax=Pseudomonas paraeruginosa TaxID=2994495 RepID=A0A2R3IV97_9PSED|nr:putative mucin TcMUC [Pseudomonas paraeruginosa]AWE90059.1 putative mucin TcMUC [Pseudomonas paraeruginosa]
MGITHGGISWLLCLLGEDALSRLSRACSKGRARVAKGPWQSGWGFPAGCRRGGCVTRVRRPGVTIRTVSGAAHDSSVSPSLHCAPPCWMLHV